MKQLDKYLALRKKAAEIKEQLDIATQLLMDEMHKQDMVSIKKSDFNVIIAKRVTKNVDELQFNHWLEQQPDMERDMFYVETFQKTKAVDVAEKVLKKDGEIVPFITGIQETEYLTVKKVAKK